MRSPPEVLVVDLRFSRVAHPLPSLSEHHAASRRPSCDDEERVKEDDVEDLKDGERGGVVGRPIHSERRAHCHASRSRREARARDGVAAASDAVGGERENPRGEL